MYLRLKIGRYVGEIREFPPLVAKDLLKNGRAEDPYVELAAQVVSSASAEEAQAKATPKRRRN